MKIRITDHLQSSDNYLGWLLVNAMTSLAKERGVDFMTMYEKELKPDDNFCHEVVLSINGIEMPLLECIKLWETNLDNYIFSKAEELIKEKFNAVNQLEYLFDDVKLSINERLKDLFPNVDVDR